ncbi:MULTISPECIES: NYN domain-containing protein [Streptomyces]|uniref:NYN domain containing protein n=1 Tax=Streptomyces viridochromogenes TaxID=1938 RepID=A0A0L8K4Z1_STRVR|nr:MULTISPECIES: NYN domain-containing protein [Streptomyces]KOG21000.1 NYN domain containing protein [Streptomyces viridochromogenes]
MEHVDRCVVLVDAGYLLGAAASLLAGEPARSRITVDHAALIRQLRERAETETALPLLRIYWFDGAPDRVPQPEHRRLRVMPRVTVRLGALTRSEGRWAQKGVDAAMHTELTELARNRACSDIVLVTGDGDLLPGLMSAKEHGVAVHLWAVQAADGDYNQSEDLVAEADERRVLDRAWITRAVRAKDLSGLCAPPPAPRPEIAAILSAPLPEAALAASAERAAEAAAARNGGPAPVGGPGVAADRDHGADGHVRDGERLHGNGHLRDDGHLAGSGHLREDGHLAGSGHLREDGHLRSNGHLNGTGLPAPASGKGVPTPKDLAGLRGPGTGATPPAASAAPVPQGASALRWSSDRGWIERPAPSLGEPAETASLPTLAMLTSAEQRWADREEDITTVGGDPFEVGQVFARRWMERLPEQSHVQKLSVLYPRIPHRIDGELLRYAARFGLLAHKDDQIDEHDRYAIRAGFWREIDVRAAAEHAPAPGAGPATP